MNPFTQTQWDELFIGQEFGAYKTLVASMEGHVQQKQDELKRDLDAIATRLADPEEIIAFHDYRVDEYLELEHFKRILMHSLFVASVSLFEFRFTHICDRAQQLSRNPISVADFGQFSIQKAKSYLEKLGVDVPAASDEWREATTLQKIRNRIVHGGGLVNPTSDIIDYVKRHQIALDPPTYILPTMNSSPQPLQLELTQSFCDQALDILARLLILLSRSCYETHWEQHAS